MMKKRERTGFPRTLRRLVCAALTLLLPLCTAWAAEGGGEAAKVDPVGRSENFAAVLYNNTNGLPTSEANAIAQTSEGFLWIGSYSGLIRYDGNSFERMDSTTGVASVVCLCVDRRDRLWIGTNDNGVAMMDRGEIRFWTEADGLGSDKICAIEEDADGSVYVGTTAGVTRISPELTPEPLDDPRIAGVYIERLRRGGDGLLYCVTNESDFFTLRNGRLVDYFDKGRTGVKGVTSILPDPDAPGTLYIGTESSGIWRGAGLSAESMERIDISPLFHVIDMQRIGSQLWICASNGIGVLDSEGFHPLVELPMNNSVNQMLQDYEGNLWFVSARQGVMKLVSNQFLDVFVRAGLRETVVNSTCMYQGRLFLGTDLGLTVLDGSRALSELPLRAARTASGALLEADDLLRLLDGCRIRSLIRDSAGRLWISTWRSHGLLRYDGEELVAFTEAEGLPSLHVRAVCETADGAMLAVVTGGVCRIEGDRVTASWGAKDGIENTESLSVAAAPNGDIVLGSNGGGVYIINGEGVRCIDKRDGLRSGIIMRIKYDPARALFWLVTSNSLAYMRTDYRVVTVRNFPYSNNFDLYENSKGDMWILSSNGIYVLPTEELVANGDLKPVHYGMANGLPCIATSNSYSELTPEGDLYIAGSSGVAKVNIETPLEDLSELKQAVPFVEADGVRVFPDENGGFTLPAGVRRLTVYGYVFNYSLTDPQVSYCLEGFDAEPVTVSRSELGPVTYTNLSGGSYRFVMELKDAMGRGSKTLSVPILKEKAIYEQLWFYLAATLAAVLLLFLLVRAILRRKMRIVEARHREEAERQRIGSELQMANQIQHSMLPHVFPPFPERREFDVYAVMDPAREVGGDFYDFFLIDEDHLCLVMADVSGKGIPAALFMMISKVVLQSYATMGQSAAAILTRANEALCADNQVDMFVTVWLGILEISTGTLTAANAGHEYPVLKRAGKPYELLKDTHGLVIGGLSGIQYKEYKLNLAPGDRIFVYTDGVPEATDAENRMFGTERMIDALNREPEASPQEILDNVRRAVDGFVREAEQFDDLTMLCLEYRGPEAK